jgi:hypothetical protein
VPPQDGFTPGPITRSAPLANSLTTIWPARSKATRAPSTEKTGVVSSVPVVTSAIGARVDGE